MKAEEIAAALAAPFEADEVKWKPQAVKGNRALAICFIDARAVMDRLDAVFGVGGWQTSYRLEGDGVVCVLRVKVGGEWVTHEDVGSFSEQPDDGDKLKAAFSDSLKRAAVHLGIARYLYSLPHQWCDYDPAKRAFTVTPKLPAWALPPGKESRPKDQAAPAQQPAREGADADMKEARRRLGACKSVAELATAWSGIPTEMRPALLAYKDTLKLQLSSKEPGQ